jgi:hypothetical protein
MIEKPTVDKARQLYRRAFDGLTTSRMNQLAIEMMMARINAFQREIIELDVLLHEEDGTLKATDLKDDDKWQIKRAIFELTCMRNMVMDRIKHPNGGGVKHKRIMMDVFKSYA